MSTLEDEVRESIQPLEEKMVDMICEYIEDSQKVLTKLEDVIDFLKDPYDNGYDYKEVLYEYVCEILQEGGIDDIWSNTPDLINVVDPDGNKIVLEDFADKLYHKIIKGVCNVIKTA